MHIEVNDGFVKKYDSLISSRVRRAGFYGDRFDHIKSKIYERILSSNSYDPNKGKVTTWLWNVCRSVISNEVKKHVRSQDAMDHPSLSLDDANNVIGEGDAGTAKDEVARIMSKAKLAPRDESIIRDYHMIGMTAPEIAELYDMETRTVEQVIYRAMKALRQVVADDV